MVLAALANHGGDWLIQPIIKSHQGELMGLIHWILLFIT
ncbi:hypothetical protein AO384_1519 [Moraxella catarrhalis]|uniref:Uncharacterized protein n=1 Tax=Moraxella catarrhalis TaxID=480 RepID=A0A198UFX3_MORCA|nr:hypothetical protein AO384_1519 [Moraxella catarrhalis]